MGNLSYIFMFLCTPKGASDSNKVLFKSIACISMFLFFFSSQKLFLLIQSFKDSYILSFLLF